jgi:hypothetical protein
MRSSAGRGVLIVAAAAAALTLLVQSAAATSPPPNDDFDSAEVISGMDGRVGGTTLGATTLPDDPTYADLHTHGGTVWYQWTAPQDGVVVFDTEATESFGIIPQTAAVYGDAPDSGHLTVDNLFNRDTAQIGFYALAGRRYHVVIDGRPQGDFVLSWYMPGPIVGSGAIVDDPGCRANTFGRRVTDDYAGMFDDSFNFAPLGFGIDFFGRQYDSAYVDVDGAVDFSRPMGVDPLDLSQTTDAIVAPFLAGTGETLPLSDLIHYGRVTYAGRPAFCVDWGGSGVPYQLFATTSDERWYETPDKLNSLQLLLVDRSDTGPGNFDIIFNYAQIQWEAARAAQSQDGLGGPSALAGFTNGDPVSPRTFELPGSGVPGSFLDSNHLTGLVYNSRESWQPGRYVFPVRNGQAPVGREVFGFVSGGGAVQMCGSLGCDSTVANALGRYSFTGVANGAYTVQAFPADGDSVHGPSQKAGVQVDDTSPASIEQDLTLTTPLPPPPGTTITSVGTGTGGVPVVRYDQDLVLTTSGCSGGTATYSLTLDGQAVPLRSGLMAEGPAGTYTTHIASTFPSYGDARVSISISCQERPVVFDLYIDPSGLVRTTAGRPVAGATVLLLRSDSGLTGTFAPVASGSASMSPANRVNPDTSDSGGRFGWDVVAGFYEIRAAHAGCADPGGAAFATTGTLSIPPPVADLELVLKCGPAPTIAAPSDVVVDATGPGGAVVDSSTLGTPSVAGGFGAVIVVTAGVPADNEFPIGTTTVTYTATDDAGNVASAGQPVHVRGAAEQLASLAVLVNGIGPGSSLAGKVAQAQASLDRGDLMGACATLSGFISEAKAQSGEKLTVAQASQLVAAATRIRAVLAC